MYTVRVVVVVVVAAVCGCVVQAGRLPLPSPPRPVRQGVRPDFKFSYTSNGAVVRIPPPGVRFSLRESAPVTPKPAALPADPPPAALPFPEADLAFAERYHQPESAPVTPIPAAVPADSPPAPLPFPEADLAFAEYYHQPESAPITPIPAAVPADVPASAPLPFPETDFAFPEYPHQPASHFRPQAQVPTAPIAQRATPGLRLTSFQDSRSLASPATDISGHYSFVTKF